MPGFKGLAVPGPSNMPFRIRQAMDIALEDHRAPDFPQFTLPLFSDLKEIFQTKTGQVFLFPGSGTGGWESAIANTLSPGDKVLASISGRFGESKKDAGRRKRGRTHWSDSRSACEHGLQSYHREGAIS